MLGNRQLYKAANALLTEYLQHGSMPTFNEFISEIVSRVGGITLGKPYTITMKDSEFSVMRRSVTNIDALNKKYNCIRSDISLLTEDVIDLLASMVNDIQYFRMLDKKIRKTAIGHIQSNYDDRSVVLCSDAKNIDLLNSDCLLNFDAGAAVLQDYDETIKLLKAASISASSETTITELLPVSNLIDDDINTPYICKVDASAKDIKISLDYTFKEEVDISYIEVINISPCDLTIVVVAGENEVGRFSSKFLNNSYLHFNSIRVSSLTLEIIPDAPVTFADEGSLVCYIGIENILIGYREKRGTGTLYIDGITNDSIKPVTPFKITPYQDIPPTTKTVWRYSFDNNTWKVINDFDVTYEIDNSPYSGAVQLPEFKAAEFFIGGKPMKVANLLHFPQGNKQVIDISLVDRDSLRRTVIYPDGVAYCIHGPYSGLTINRYLIPNVSDVINNLWDNSFDVAIDDSLTPGEEIPFYVVYAAKGNDTKSVFKSLTSDDSYLTYATSLLPTNSGSVSEIFLSAYVLQEDTVSYLYLSLTPDILPAGTYFRANVYCIGPDGGIVHTVNNIQLTISYNNNEFTTEFVRGYGHLIFEAENSGDVTAKVTLPAEYTFSGKSEEMTVTKQITVTKDPVMICCYPMRSVKDAYGAIVGYNLDAETSIGGAAVTDLYRNNNVSLFRTPSKVPGARYSIENDIQMFLVADLTDIVEDNEISKLDVRVRRGRNNWRIDSYHYEVPVGADQKTLRGPYTPNDFIELRGIEKPTSMVKYRYSEVSSKDISFPFYEYRRITQSDTGYEDIVLHKFMLWFYIKEDIPQNYVDLIKDINLNLSGGVFEGSGYYIYINNELVTPVQFTDEDDYPMEIINAHKYCSTRQIHRFIKVSFHKGWNSIVVITENITPSIDKIQQNQIAPPSELLMEPTSLLYNTGNVGYTNAADISHNSYYNTITNEPITYGGPVSLLSKEFYVGNDILLDLAYGTNSTGVFKDLDPLALGEIWAEKKYMNKVNKYTLFYKIPRTNQDCFSLIGNDIVVNHLPITNYTVEIYDIDYSKYPSKLYLACDMYNDDDLNNLTPSVYGVEINMKEYIYNESQRTRERAKEVS